MKKEIENTLKSIMPADDSMDQLLAILDLPDKKFSEIYPKLNETFVSVFKSKNFQQDVIRNIETYRNNNTINIEEEKAAIEELIGEINNDDSISDDKKNFIITLIETSALSTYELLENPRERIEVKIQKISDNAKLPAYAHPSDAGADIYAAEDITIEPRNTVVIKTGIKVAIPAGYEIQIRPRSGLSLKTALRIANAPGTIDSDYRGEIGVIMTNIGQTPEIIKVGDKIAQMVIAPIPMIKWVEVEELDTTERGEGGFGSTGKS